MTSITKWIFPIILGNLVFGQIMGVLRAQETMVETAATEDVTEEIYEGDILNGVRHGFGKLMFPDGRVYEGGFVQGVPADSDGLMTFADGSTYEGTFVDGQMQGFGTYRWARGDVYVGTFTAGSISGNGRMYWVETNTTYTGSIEQGQMHGLGKLIWPDGRSYIGTFNANARYGFGVYALADGSTYRGFFEADQRHGDGVYTSSTGEMVFQRWNFGEIQIQKPLQMIEHCGLKIDEFDWMFESDECINGIAHGSGTAVRLDGQAYISNGVFVVGHLVSGVVTSLAGQPGL